jgi:hypothetical protein
MLGLFSDGPSYKYKLKTLSLTNQRLSLFSIAGAALELIACSTVRSIVVGRIGAVLALNPLQVFRVTRRQVLQRGLPPASSMDERCQIFNGLGS